MTPATPPSPTDQPTVVDQTRELLLCSPCGQVVPVPQGAAGAVPCPSCGRPTQRVRLASVPAPVPLSTRSGTPFGRYLLVKELGPGGMGVVHEAWDPQLNRSLALKTLFFQGQVPEKMAVERFLREARAAAKLRHPSIVAVHDVGEADGRYFFTMDLVRGANLEERLRAPDSWEGLPLRRRVEILAQVADALGYAHSQGIVHRDVKPSNILIDSAADGTPRAVLTDFGLAKDVSTPAAGPLTATGALLGTPQYMSPEQAGGPTDPVGAASDVFSFGVVLYRAITGVLPFEGEGMAAIFAAMNEDPVPPSKRNPRIHRDLETLCLRCLEKDPARRFPDGSALASEMKRYLDGEPIQSRHVSRWERGLRRLRKHRVAIGTVSAALVGLLGLGGYALHEGHAARTREVKARESQARAEELMAKSAAVSRVLSRWSLLAGPLRSMEAGYENSTLTQEQKRSDAGAAWRLVEAFVQETPGDSASQATALAVAGWARRLAGFPDEGIEWMRRAARTDPDVPYGALIEAFVSFSAYTDKQRLPDLTGGPAGLVVGAPPPETPEMAALRRVIDERLAATRQATVWGREAAEGFQAAMEGIGSQQRGDYPAAEAALTRALAAPDLRPFEATLLFARAKVRFLLQEFDGGLADVARVRELWPGHAFAFFLAGRLHLGVAVRAECQGGDTLPPLDQALADLSDCIRCDPSIRDAWNSRGLVHHMRGVAIERRGERARTDLDQAVADFTSALKIPPANTDALENRANALHDLAVLDSQEGQDAQPRLADAMADLEEVLHRGKDTCALRTNLSAVRLESAEDETHRGKDPRPTLLQVIADCDRAIELDPVVATAYLNRGMAHLNLARFELAGKRDPSPEFDRAASDLGAAIERAPSSFKARYGRAMVLTSRGEAEEARGVDPTASLKRALEDMNAALAISPHDADGLAQRASVYWALGVHRMKTGENASESFDKAMEDYGTAVKANPRDWRAHYNLGAAYEAREMFDKAAEEFRAASKIVGGSRPSIREAVARTEARAKAATDAARVPWRRKLAEGHDAVQGGDYARAKELYEAAYVEAGDAFSDPANKIDALNVSFSLARVYSVLSSGRKGPGRAVEAIDPAVAGQLRDAAFNCLGIVVTLGVRQASAFEGTEDFAPLHSDPRWEELLGRLKK